MQRYFNPLYTDICFERANNSLRRLMNQLHSLFKDQAISIFIIFQCQIKGKLLIISLSDSSSGNPPYPWKGTVREFIKCAVYSDLVIWIFSQLTALHDCVFGYILFLILRALSLQLIDHMPDLLPFRPLSPSFS